MKWAGSRDKIFSPSGRGRGFFLTSLFIELIENLVDAGQTGNFSGPEVSLEEVRKLLRRLKPWDEPDHFAGVIVIFRKVTCAASLPCR